MVLSASSTALPMSPVPAPTPCAICVILSSGGGGGAGFSAVEAAGAGADAAGAGLVAGGAGGVSLVAAGGFAAVAGAGPVSLPPPHAIAVVARTQKRIGRSMGEMIHAHSLEARFDFVRMHTALARPRFVPEVVMYTATELTPLWNATLAWLGSFGIDAPFWSVPWAGGQGLARWVLDHPEEVRGRHVVDFGAGSGLVGIACLHAGAASVRAIDVDPLSEAACLLNARANHVAIDFTCDDVVGRPIEADLIVAGDVWYERQASARFGPWLGGVARSGVRVVTGDPGRAYVPADVTELARLEVPTTQDLESAEMRVTRVLELRGRA